MKGSCVVTKHYYMSIKALLYSTILFVIILFVYMIIINSKIVAEEKKQTALILKLLMNKKVDDHINELTTSELDIIFGKPSSPQTIYMFSNYFCEHCNSFFQDLYPELYKKFIKPGRVNLVVKHLASPKKEMSYRLARYALCLFQKGKAEEFHNLIIQNIEDFDNEKLEEISFQMGIELAIIDSCSNKQEIKQHLENDAKIASKLGIRGTPSFVVGKELIVGASDLSRIIAALEEDLNQTDNSICQ